MRRISLPLALCLAVHTPARAETPFPWPAIGQIIHGQITRRDSAPPAAGQDRPRPSRAICTGTLVAPDLVLTAAHCLRLRSGATARTVRFAAGWHQGRAVAFRRGAAVIRSGQDGLAGDLALLVLDTPIPPDLVPPLPIATPAPAETPLHLRAYRRSAPDTLAPPATCRIVAAEPALLGLDCPVVSGNSGAPLMVQRDGRWQIVAVMVAQARSPGPVRSVAVIPDPVLAARIDAR